MVDPETTSDKHVRRFRMRRSLRPLTAIACSSVCVVVLALSLIGCLPSPTYLADQCSHFRIAYLLLTLVVLILSLICRSRIAVSLSAVILLVNGCFCAPFFLGKGSESSLTTSGAQSDVKLLVMNLYGWRNQDHPRAIKYVQQVQPDILCLSEVNRIWLGEFDQALPSYKYKFNEGISGGAAIYSRIPIEQTFPREGRWFKRYGTRGVINLAGTKVTLISAHPPAPSSHRKWQDRNAEFGRLASEADDRREPMILIGDLNSSPWSWYFQDLLKKGRLIDSEVGHGLQPTWNALMRLPPMVPIDHCLTSPEITVASRETGPRVGSDHLPLLVSVRLPRR